MVENVIGNEVMDISALQKKGQVHLKSKRDAVLLERFGILHLRICFIVQHQPQDVRLIDIVRFPMKIPLDFWSTALIHVGMSFW